MMHYLYLLLTLLQGIGMLYAALKTSTIVHCPPQPPTPFVKNQVAVASASVCNVLDRALEANCIVGKYRD